MVSDDLRAAVRNSGQTIYALNKATGINKGTINAFLDGGETSLDKAAKLATAVGYKLVMRKNK